MKEDLNLTSRQYSNCVSVFYSTYLAAELPAVLVLKRANVKYYMSFFGVFLVDNNPELGFCSIP
ncbi:AEL_collapsed_G0032170.mRNA.1.CDS.1 [Saccharomyces cerevisiae]|nr:AEL_collapsed_G0032170.mRNA.1.CDS.1 [Saccharomyces cerevisiae]